MSEVVMDINKIMEYLPHRYPFLLVDRQGVLYRHSFDKTEGFADFSAGRRVRLSNTMRDRWRARLRVCDQPLGRTSSSIKHH